MEPFAVAGTQGDGADQCGIKRLPTDGEFRPLRVVLSACRRLKWEGSTRQNGRGVLAVPLLALGKIEFETVSAGEIPSRTGDGNTDLLVHCPDIAVHPEALPIDRANRLKRCVERVTSARKSRCVVLTAQSKGKRSGRKIEDVAVKSGIIQRQLHFTRVLQVDVNTSPGHLAVPTELPTEGVKCRGRIRVQKRVAQSRLADLANGDVRALIPGIAETRFPVPGLEVVAKLAHLPPKADIEEAVVVSEFFTSRTSVINPAEANTRGHRDRNAVDDQRRIANRERIERVLDRHADAIGTKERICARTFEWIGRKWHRRQRRIKI